LRSLYAFVDNDGIGYVDPDGLARIASPMPAAKPRPPKKPKPDPPTPPDEEIAAGNVPRCHMIVYLGHNNPPGVTPRVPTPIKVSRGAERCAYASVAACWSDQVSVEAPIPGIENRPSGKINLLAAESLALADFAVAKAKAYRLCGKVCCCKKVTVRLDCSGLAGWEQNLCPACGSSFTLTCPNNH
jgi:hypothetical protein